MKYSFTGNDLDAVEIPELEGWVADIVAVCARHGIGFNIDDGHDTAAYIVLEPFKTERDGEEMEALLCSSIGTAYDFRNEFMVQAKERSTAIRDERHKERAAAERALEASRRRVKNEMDERALLADGVVVAGKRYKLVEE